MKYYKKSDSYKASNVLFHCPSTTAYSYSWWCFVKIINGQLIFNNYKYSNSTIRHQYKVRALLAELGLKVDRFVQVRGGLQNITTLRELNEKENKTLTDIEAAKEYMRKRRNERARQRRLERKTALKAVICN